jgi:CDP-glucose 4,6-dehydratase
MRIDRKFWKNKRVMVTGHTGFKGGWLTVILDLLGSKIYGYALSPKGKNSFYKETKIKKIFNKDIKHDIRDYNHLKKKIREFKPEIIIHLAAQSSVIESFKDPRNTVSTNVIGTYNLLESVKNQKSVKSLLIITTDKVYQNYEKSKYFDENSKLGGDDMYSGSKACCEILINSFNKSFFQNSNCSIATVRAGNCFGGGDWTEDRITKDALENFYANKTLILRSPTANRPWQHVIEPLFGYLILIQKLYSTNGKKFQGPWNFGPSSKQNMQVYKFANLIKTTMKSKSKIKIKKNFYKFKKEKIFESKFLNINSKKVKKYLKWKPNLSIKESVELTVDWYINFKKKKDLLFITRKQIIDYMKKTKI